MHILKSVIVSVLALSAISSCKKSRTTDSTANGPKINFIFRFDSTQARLNAVGQPVPVSAGNGAQSPKFNLMSAHYLELTPNGFTALGAGDVLYKAPETTVGGATAIDFSKANFAGPNETFLSVPIKTMVAGTYNWLRVSLAYQNYTVNMRALGQTFPATLASFIGYNTYVQSYHVKDSLVTVNANKAQGYWGFEGNYPGYGFLSTGQAPAGATTVPNPLFASSPIPAGSCVVTGQFASPLIITGTETSDVNIIVSLSTNKSFEWKEVSGPGTFDPADGDQVVDMGIRGMIPYKQ